MGSTLRIKRMKKLMEWHVCLKMEVSVVCGTETQPGQCCFVFGLFFVKEVGATNSSLITDKIIPRGKIGAREYHTMTKILLTAGLRPKQTKRQNETVYKVFSI